ncbi:MAG: class I SAM-dependent methyltransferase [Lachnospiraceae bacterium]|nr:class I SAM-dependent methyltransferase [Lachnospiraceae bacterium]
MRNLDFKGLSVKEFTKAAEKYETGDAGVYELCKKDYPEILEEIEEENFETLLDCGCGPAPMISLLHEKYPERHYTGIDLTPKMIEKAREKNLDNTTFVVGDCENLPFEDDSFDVVICSMSMHHYPHPEKFLHGVKRVLKPNGRVILRDMTSYRPVLWFINTVELPAVNMFGFGDVKVYSVEDIREMCNAVGLKLEKGEHRRWMRLHCVARKIK